MKCAGCGGEMIQRSPLRLLFAGSVMRAATPLVFLVPYFRVLDIVPVTAGGYLIVWALAGRGFWCRQCKKFSVIRG